MKIMRIVVAIFLSIFSTIVMSYIALAASIGPWIETTLVLFSMFIFQSVIRSISVKNYVDDVSLTTAAGGIGGILATGLAFSLPALYFLSPDSFNNWMASPFNFITHISFFSFTAGSFGLLMAAFFEESLLIKQQMKFPIGQLIHTAIAAPGQLRKSCELALGFFGTALLLFVRSSTKIIKSNISLVPSFSWQLFSFPSLIVPLDQLPMYLAVGFITGHVIAYPLLVGFCAKILCLDPLYYLYTHTNTVVYQYIFSYLSPLQLTNSEFILAFCSGMVLYGALLSFIDLCITIFKWSTYASSTLFTAASNCFKEHTLISLITLYSISVLIASTLFLMHYHFSLVQQITLFSFVIICSYTLIMRLFRSQMVATWGYRPHFNGAVFVSVIKEVVTFSITSLTQSSSFQSFNRSLFIQTGLVVMVNGIYLWHLNFSFIQQGYLLGATALCIYQMLIIAGKMGIIPLGRFATFVMVPSMFLFNLTTKQIILIAAFVEVAGGVAGDVLFGRKLALLSKTEHKQIVVYQWLGLLVASLSVGVVFWLFISSLGLGTLTGFPATKAASRALLIGFKNFDWCVLIMGVIFGYLIKYTRVNPALLLGGILMPPTISLMLITGGLITYLTKDKEKWYPLLSGVSSGNSIWMLAETFIKVLY